MRSHDRRLLNGKTKAYGCNLVRYTDAMLKTFVILHHAQLQLPPVRMTCKSLKTSVGANQWFQLNRNPKLSAREPPSDSRLAR